jgi:hypothetical protein
MSSLKLYTHFTCRPNPTDSTRHLLEDPNPEPPKRTRTPNRSGTHTLHPLHATLILHSANANYENIPRLGLLIQ